MRSRAIRKNDLRYAAFVRSRRWRGSRDQESPCRRTKRENPFPHIYIFCVQYMDRYIVECIYVGIVEKTASIYALRFFVLHLPFASAFRFSLWCSSLTRDRAREGGRERERFRSVHSLVHQHILSLPPFIFSSLARSYFLPLTSSLSIFLLLFLGLSIP